MDMYNYTTGLQWPSRGGEMVDSNKPFAPNEKYARRCMTSRPEYSGVLTLCFNYSVNHQ